MPIHFYLRTDKQSANGKCPIYVDCHFNDARIRKSTKEKCSPENWQNKPGKFVSSKEVNAKGINNQLQYLQNSIDNRYRELNNRGELLTDQDVEDIISPRKKKKPESSPLSPVVIPLADRSIYEILLDWAGKNKGKKSFNYIRQYKQITAAMAKYEPDGVYLKDLNQDWIESYVGYILDELPDIQSNNTISNHIKFIRIALRHVHQDYSWVINPYGKTSSKPALSWDELIQLYHFPIQNKSLSDCRDCACFMGFTGLRYSDASKLRPVDLEKNQSIRIVQKKTSKEVRIPLNAFAIELIEKHKNQNSNLLPYISNQKTNFYLKEIGQLAGLTREIRGIKFRGSERSEIIRPLYEIMSCHIFRHTFATISLNRGMDYGILADIMGIDAGTVKTYAKALDTTKMEQMKKVWES